MRAFNFGTYGRARPAKRGRPHSGSLYFAGAEEDGGSTPPAPSRWTLTRTFAAPRRPWSFTAASCPATRGTGGRTAVQERFTGLTSRGVGKPAAPPPNRSSATPSTGPGESLLRADVARRAASAWGRGGWVCSSAWICDFSSPHSTIACADGSRYNPTTSRTLVSSSGSLENLKASVCQGLTSCSAHTRDRAVADSQLVGQQPT
jgi:hypothetical protein